MSEQLESPIAGELTMEDFEAGPLHINSKPAAVGDTFKTGDLLSIGPPDGLEGDGHCHKCNKETEWRPQKRGSKRVKCSGCGDIYPCRTSCDHLDCEADKRQQRIK